MPKFSIGQRVRVVSGSLAPQFIGDIGTILGIRLSKVAGQKYCYDVSLSKQWLFVENTLKLVPRRSPDVQETMRQIRHVKNDVTLSEWIKDVQLLEEKV